MSERLIRGSEWGGGGGGVDTRLGDANVSCQLKFWSFVSCQLNSSLFVSCQLNGY